MAELIQTNYRMRIEGLGGVFRDGPMDAEDVGFEGGAKFHMEFYLSTTDADALEMRLESRVGDEVRTLTVYIPFAGAVEAAQFIRHIKRVMDVVDAGDG